MLFIADTGFVAGFWDPNERVRKWAIDFAKAHSGPYLTCEPVLTEASYLVGARRIAHVYLAGDYVIRFHWEEHREAVLQYLDRYADRDIDLADACLLVMVDLNPRCKVLTIDRADFTVYRTRNGKPVQCIFPPEK